jgi:hypothetical protein
VIDLTYTYGDPPGSCAPWPQRGARCKSTKQPAQHHKTQVRNEVKIRSAIATVFLECDHPRDRLCNHTVIIAVLFRMAQPAQEGRGPRLVIANPRVSFKVLDIHDNARDSLTRGINSFLDTGGSSPLMLDGRLHGEEKPLREVYDTIVDPRNVQRLLCRGRVTTG